MAFLICSRILAIADIVQPVSQHDSTFAASSSGGGHSGSPILSSDGRYVLFASTAGNLTLSSNGVPFSDTFPGRINVFLRDRAIENTVLVSVNRQGTGGGDGDSLPSGLSVDGRYALFESTAADLVAGDTNGVGDVFVRDLAEGTTRLVSASGNGVSDSSVMTPDGRYVAFVSAATNLVSGDTNKIPDVFVWDRETGSMTLASVDATAALDRDGSESPQIAAGGRYVAFYSTATNLVPGVIRAGGVYIRDLAGATTTLISTNALSTDPASAGLGVMPACDIRMSDDGRFVAFMTSTNSSGISSTTGMVCRFDRETGLTDIIYTNPAVPFRWYQNSHLLDMTPDGRRVAFVANVNGSLGGLTNAAYVWDALAATNILVSAGLDGLGGEGTCESLGISSNGQSVAFVSSARNLTTTTLDGEFQLYLRDIPAGLTRLMSATINSNASGVDPTIVPSMNADGDTIAFESSAATLVANDRNRASDVFVRTSNAETNELISARHTALASLTADGASGFFPACVSANGRYVAFASDADDLVPNDTNNQRDVFVRDLMTGAVALVSADSNGVALPAISSDPAISGDGRYIAFSSRIAQPGALRQVHVRDLQAGSTRPVSVAVDGVSLGNGESWSPAISDDGRRVLFRSKAQNLASGTTGIDNLFLHDQQSGTNYALTKASSTTLAAMTPDARYVFYYGTVSVSPRLYLWDSRLATIVYSNTVPLPYVLAVSPNGQRLAFWGLSLTAVDRISNSNFSLATGFVPTRSRLQFSSDSRFLLYSTRNAGISADTNSVEDIYLYDFETSSRLLVSRGANGVNSPNAASDSPTMSSDARFIAYRSAATNIVSADGNQFSDVFLFDRLRETTMLVSADRSENFTANRQSLQPIFSSNGRTLVFQSWASDPITNDFNQTADLYAFQFLEAAIDFSTSNQGPLLSWPALPGHSYRAQYKNTLDDASWQDVIGPVSILGYRGSATDFSSPFNGRFYRIVSE